ncbi:four helix bundle protein [Halalkalibaculum sp. DA384]|uniref:four helix bundle protein n=1 Tax=Halalkalibaculum sp. DA384 TaxID=3373606 RepID=UPI003754BF41
MKFREWVKTVPKEITNDTIWNMQVYKYALFISDVAWQDISHLSKRKVLVSLCDQLYRATGSVSANLEEGYSKKSRLDRARFYEYSLGSARESRGWYFRARHSLPDKVFKSRSLLLTEIIKQLLHIVPTERQNKIKEHDISYSIDQHDTYSKTIESIKIDFQDPK